MPNDKDKDEYTFYKERYEKLVSQGDVSEFINDSVSDLMNVVETRLYAALKTIGENGLTLEYSKALNDTSSVGRITH
jgi:hypothetical protein